MLGKVGIIYGSDTGITEDITKLIQERIDAESLEIIEVHKVQQADFRRFDLLLLGLSTWYDGDLQSDWEDYFEEFKEIDFTDKIIAIYGLGDQEGYDKYFIDGVGMLAVEIIKNGGTLIGHWSSAGYEHSASKAQMDEHTFYGLALDEDNQTHLTDDRIDQWLAQISREFAELHAEFKAK